MLVMLRHDLLLGVVTPCSCSHQLALIVPTRKCVLLQQCPLSMQDLLTLELRWSSREGAYPDRLTVHRKGRPGLQEEEPLAHELRCWPNIPQVCVDQILHYLLLLLLLRSCSIDLVHVHAGASACPTQYCLCCAVVSLHTLAAPQVVRSRALTA